MKIFKSYEMPGMLTLYYPLPGSENPCGIRRATKSFPMSFVVMGKSHFVWGL